MMPKMYLFNTCATVSHGICLPLGMRLGISALSICIPVFFFLVIMVCDGFMSNTRGVEQGK